MQIRVDLTLTCRKKASGFYQGGFYQSGCLSVTSSVSYLKLLSLMVCTLNYHHRWLYDEAGDEIR